MLVEKQPARFSSFLRQLVKLNLGSKGSFYKRRRRARPASSYAGGIKKCNNFVAVCIRRDLFDSIGPSGISNFIQKSRLVVTMFLSH